MEQSLAEHGLRGRGRHRTGKDTRPKIGKRPRGKTTTKGPGRAPLKSATLSTFIFRLCRTPSFPLQLTFISYYFTVGIYLFYLFI